jgi:hypothetical protein
MINAGKILFLLMLLGAPCWVDAQVLWEHNWGAVYEDACEVRALPDGGTVFLASIGSVDSWLVRTDALGDTLWSRRITFADFCTVQPMQDGGFFLGGNTRANLREEVAYKVDAQGDSVWAYVYPDSIDHGVYTALALPNSNFLLTGYSRRNNYDMWVRLIDETGLSLWAGTYGSSQLEFGALPTLCLDGGFLLSTTQYNPNPQFYFVRIDANGQVLWTRNWSTPVPIGGAVPTALPDGGFVVIGWIEQVPGNYDSYIVRLDSLGNTIWARAYGGMGFEERTSSGILLDKEGGYTYATITQGTFGPDEDRDIALLRLDTAGNVAQHIRIGRSEDDVPRYVVQAADSSYIILGYTRSFVPAAQQVYLAKVDLSGCNAHFYWPGFPEQDTLCPGDTATLDAGAGFVSYLWSNGDTTRTTEVPQADTVYVAATDSNGCVFYSNLFRGRFPAAPVFTWTLLPADAVAFDLNFSGTGTWDFGDGSAPVTGGDVNHTYLAPGNYQVCFTALVPGCGPVSVCDSVNLSIIGLEDRLDARLEIFPQPALTLIDLRWQGKLGWQAQVFDAAGRLVQQFDVDGATYRLDVAHWPSGIYFLHATADGASTHAKIIKAKP